MCDSEHVDHRHDQWDTIGREERGETFAQTVVLFCYLRGKNSSNEFEESRCNVHREQIDRIWNLATSS